MAGSDVENFLAALYTRAELREEFLSAPESVLAQFELTAAERQGLLRIDKSGLALAGDFYGAMRAKYSGWMHSRVGTISLFENRIEESLLSAGEAASQSLLEEDMNTDSADQNFCSALYDLLPFDTGNWSNLEYLLEDNRNAESIHDIWLNLKATILKNQLLLRCSVLSATCRDTPLWREAGQRMGNYVVYVGLGSQNNELGHVNYLNVSATAKSTRNFPLKRGTAITVPAHFLQKIQTLSGVSSNREPVALAYMTLPAL